MGIRRNEAEEPELDITDNVENKFLGYFFKARWRRTPDWNIILKHVERTRQASQMIDISLYPSTTFFAALDMLETNLYVIDDLFYYLTCQRLIGGDPMSKAVLYTLGFWNMDCYKILEQISEGLIQAGAPLIECLKHDPIWDISLKIVEKGVLSVRQIGYAPIPTMPYTEEKAYAYVCEHYKATQIDKEALLNQIVKILNLIQHYHIYFWNIYAYHIDFPELLAWFRKSEKAQKDYIEPWRKDFEGSRENLIAKMEKDQKLGPWVNKYDHLSKDRYVHFQLFYSEKHPAEPINKDECYNTDNWISILTVAAVLQEYDEQHVLPVEKLARKPKAPSPFTDFIIDTPRSEAVLKRLHEIIDGKRPKVCALTILAAVQSGILMQPTYKALFSEFPEIGDRKNYEYYLQRKNNYSDDINSIAKGF